MDKLLPKGVEVDDEYVFCHRVGEASNHLLVQCSVVKGIWDKFFSCFNVNKVSTGGCKGGPH